MAPVKIMKFLNRFISHPVKTDIERYRESGVKIGSNCNIWGATIDSLFPFLVEIGNDCTITGGVKILAHDAAPALLGKGYKIGKVIIRDKVFVGMDTVIMPGVEIGPNVIVGANSVVTKSIPQNSVAAGVPARIISSLEDYLSKSQGDIHPTWPLHPGYIKELQREVKEIYE